METNKKYVGIIVNENGQLYFKNKKGKLFGVPQTDQNREIAKRGDLCIFEVINSNTDEFSFGYIVDVVERNGNAIPEGMAIAKAYNIPKATSMATKNEVESIPSVVTGEQIKNIRDLRDVPFITIDPDTAKDFDDAVFACKNPDGTYSLKVAIANVASYIKPNSNLFHHAMDRCNSSYLGETCYPMLPEELSNGICSLNEGVDRLVMCTSCTMDDHGHLLNYSIEPAVIKSRHRLTYKEADYLYFGENADGDTLDHTGIEDKTGDIMDSLVNLYDVSQILYKARMDRGAFDIQTQKLGFKLDESKSRVVGYAKDHNEAFTSVIEETAILANEIWGEIAEIYNLPFVYRNHKNIDPESIGDLRGKLKQFDLIVPKPCSSKHIQSIINKVQGKRIEEYVVSTILKEMEPAFYDVHNGGHAGLAINSMNITGTKKYFDSKTAVTDEARERYFKQTGKSNGLSFEGDITHSAYVHSTSPIRRGADLLDQIQMLSFLNNGKILFRQHDLDGYCDSLNFHERNSARAENDYNEMLSALWASENIGKVFHGCTVAEIGQSETKIVAPDGYKMSLPQNYRGLRKKDLKIGKKLEPIVIDKVSIFPPKVEGCREVIKQEENMFENEL